MFRPKITSGSVDLVQLWCILVTFGQLDPKWPLWPEGWVLRLNFMVFLFRRIMVIQWIFQGMRVLVVRDFSKKFYPIRNCFGVFKNQQLPKKFVFCQNMREREECSYQNACLFSHSITEMAIWQIQKQSKSQWSFLDSFHPEFGACWLRVSRAAQTTYQQ